MHGTRGTAGDKGAGETMAEPGKSGPATLLADIKRRLVSNRWTLVAALALFSLLLLAGRIGPVTALLMSAAMLAVGAFAPVRTARARRAAAGTGGRAAPDLEHLGPVLDGIPEPVLLLDARGTVRHVNTEYRRTMGDMQRGGSALIRFRSPEVLEMIQAALDGSRPSPVEYAERTPRERWHLVSIQPLDPGTAAQDGFVMHFRDLAELRRSERMRSDFIANASHELRTPLASLSGFIETLAGPARADTAARDRFLPIMQEQAERMSRLIDDLLSLSRFETALGRSAYGPVDLAEVLVHVVGAMQPLARSHRVTIEPGEMPGPGLALVHGGRDELIQLFSNLVENGVKYGGSGGRVDMLMQETSLGGLAAWTVEVRDHGPGIAEEHIPRLTERFYRVDVESSKSKQGTGLGLAIVKHLVTRHEGRLMIRSRPGEGAQFIVTIPAASPQKPANQENRFDISNR